MALRGATLVLVAVLGLRTCFGDFSEIPKRRPNIMEMESDTNYGLYLGHVSV